MNEPILIVEDNALNLKLAKITLETAGFEVRTATNAKEALNTLLSFVPKLILMDIQLPEIDGLKLTRKLKNDPLFGHIKIVAITAYAMKGDREKTLTAGCDDYLSKPVEPSVLVDTIRECLSEKITTTEKKPESSST